MTQNNTVVSPGELKAGMFVTVLKWRIKKTSGGGFMSGPPQEYTPTYGCGDALLIKAINFPYVAVKNLSLDNGNCEKEVVLNIHEVIFMEINRYFVKARTYKETEGNNGKSVPW